MVENQGLVACMGLGGLNPNLCGPPTETRK